MIANTPRSALLSIAGAFLLAGSAAADVAKYAATMDGAQEVPPVSTPAVGSAEIDIDSVNSYVYVLGTYSGLQGNATAAHLHAGAVGQNGGIIINLNQTGGVAGTFSGGAFVSGTDLAAILAGDTYVNVHTTAHGGGEIRGQVVPAAVTMSISMDGAQEVPPVSTPATGTSTLSIDPNTGEVIISGTYQNLQGNATAAHLHGPADVGQNAGILLNLSHTGGTTGTFSGSGFLSLSDAAEVIAGRAYVNVHTTAHGGGEIRGQTDDGLLGTNYCVAETNSLGMQGRIEATGSLLVSDNDLTLAARDLPLNKFGYFLASKTSQQVFPVAGSDGRLCIVGPKIGRFVQQIQNSGTSGQFSIQVDLTSIPVAPPVPVLPGECWNFQAWYRDKVGSTNTSNFTDAVSITFQ